MNTSSFNAVYAMGSIGETLLAAPGSVTCIVDGNQSIISGCVAHILENIDIEHSVGHVINSALQCHHENYHSCTKSLLVMTAMWLREMDSLVQQFCNAAHSKSLCFELYTEFPGGEAKDGVIYV
ncbi:hypothetical protein LSAT2_015222 [Lamellibrachia satsuma]|nr:hypothetical protein LSAT2_015222 [Lamellibrachia satsuma]